MFNKRKVLYSAMAVALMSSGGSAWADAGLALISPLDGTDAATMASELINPKGGSTEVIPSASTFNVQYTFDDAIEENFYVTFTLSGGAVWGKAEPDISSDYLIHSDGAPITAVDGGENDKDSTVTFLVSGGVDAENTLSFSFTITDKEGVLGTSGSDIKLSVDLKVPFGEFPLETGLSASDKQVSLVSSKDGASVSFVASDAGSSKIDVSQGSLLFLSNSGTNSTTANLGKVIIKSSSAKDLTLSSAWTPEPDSASVVITSAPFNSSVTGGEGYVFIDADGSNTYSEDTDYIADEVTDTEATWDLDSEAITDLLASCNTDQGCSILIVADGTTQIEATSEAPQASATLVFNTGERTTLGKLLHIKRNGSVCTLYNIPNSAAVDELSVRITNMSNKEGLVLGSLRGLDGKDIFSAQTLVQALAPNTTVRVDAATLKTLAGGTDWTGRAVLTISSNIPNGNMEAYGLVRNKAGGPLMNLSTGASGSGCDE
jgi:hypothetical protein